MKYNLKHLNALKTFEAAARFQSFAKAARELNVSQSVVSHHVNNLEHWFGVKLFRRFGNRIELTPDGELFAPRIAMGLQIMSESCDNLLRRTASQKLTVYSEPAIASRWLRKKISTFSSEHPSLEVQLSPASQAPTNLENEGDVLIHFSGNHAVPNFQVHRMFPVDAFPACAPSLKKKVRFKDGVSDFSNVPILHDNGYYVWQRWFSKFIPHDDAWMKGKLYSDFSLSIDAAVDEEGVFLADAIICARELAAGKLVQLDDRTARCTWYAISIKNGQSDNSAAMVFLNWILGNLPSYTIGLDENLGGDLTSFAS